MWLPLSEMRINCCQNSSGRRNASRNAAVDKRVHLPCFCLKECAFLIDLPYAALSPKHLDLHLEIGNLDVFLYFSRCQKQPLRLSGGKKCILENATEAFSFLLVYPNPSESQCASDSL